MITEVMDGTDVQESAGVMTPTAGAVASLPREKVELMESRLNPTKLWWEIKVDGSFSGWNELESTVRIAGLVRSLQDFQDTLQLEDDNPVTRYAQIMMLWDDAFHVEIAAVRPDGVHNWRVGRGRQADEASNAPDIVTNEVQELTEAETIEVLTSWAAGHGLPLDFGGALHVYPG